MSLHQPHGIMVSRKFPRPLGSISKVPGPGQEVQEHGQSSKEETGFNTENGSRRSRLALRTGSSAAPARVALRTMRPQSQQTSPVMKRVSQRHGSPARISGGSRSSVQSKSASTPEKKPWGAPIVRSSPYHEQSVSKRKRINFENPASEETSQPHRRRPPRRQYSLSFLLALRPALVQDGMSYWGYPRTEESDVGLGFEDIRPRSFAQNGHYNQKHGYNIPDFPKLKSPWHEKIREYTPGPAKQRRRYSTIATHELHQPSPSSYHDQPRLIDTPSKATAQAEVQAPSIEELESRIRSALRNRGGKNFDFSGRMRSVRWDPSIECNPGTPSRPTTFETAQVAKDVLETPQEASIVQETKTPETPLSQRGGITVRKKKNKQLYEYMKSITELRSRDRKKLLQLLEALKNLDSDESSSDTDNAAEKARLKAKRAERLQKKSKLNPTAAAFQDLVPLQATNSPTKPALRAPRQVFVLPNDNLNSHEPLWVKRGAAVPKPERPDIKLYQIENATHPRADVFQSLTKPKERTTSTGKAFIIPHHTKLPRLQPLHPSVHIVSSPVPLTTMQLRSIESTSSISNTHPWDDSRVNPRLPIIDLTTGRIPTEDEHGREAHVVPWGNRILEQFRRRYPWTGILRAPAPAPIRNTHAASIQQRLEYIIMEQKEKLRGEGLNERCTNSHGPKKAKSLYQEEKYAMRRLKADIRRDELQRKMAEHSPLATETKLRVRMDTGEERISETSTVVDPIDSTGGAGTEGEEGGGSGH